MLAIWMRALKVIAASKSRPASGSLWRLAKNPPGLSLRVAGSPVCSV
jgi:hypothetical protein